MDYSQVPPDFYIPDLNEDLQNPDERIDRKEKNIFFFFIPYIDMCYTFVYWFWSFSFQSTLKTSTSSGMMNIMKVTMTMIIKRIFDEMSAPSYVHPFVGREPSF